MHAQGQMLMAIPGLSMDNLLIIFTMIDRHDPESKWAPLWASLPAAYYTGGPCPLRSCIVSCFVLAPLASCFVDCSCLVSSP